MSDDGDRVAAKLASTQSGLFARWQLLAGDVVVDVIKRRVRTERWLRVAPGVYRLRGAPRGPDDDRWRAWLAVGQRAALSHECAAEMHGLVAVPRGRLVLIDRHGWHHRVAGVVVHQIDDLQPSHVTLVRGLPTTTAPRTMVDLAAVLSTVRMAKALDEAVAARRVTEREVARVLGDVARPRKPGVKRLARVLDERAPGRAVAASVLEDLLLAAVLMGGNPPPVAQYPHPGRHPGAGRVDFAYPDVRVILEADGRRWHQRMADLSRDRARDNEAARAGWLTMRFMHEELRNDPEDVGRAVREVRVSRQ